MCNFLTLLLHSYYHFFLALGLCNWTASTVLTILTLLAAYIVLCHINRHFKNPVLLNNFTPLELFVSICDGIDPGEALWSTIHKIPYLRMLVTALNARTGHVSPGVRMMITIDNITIDFNEEQQRLEWLHHTFSALKTTIRGLPYQSRKYYTPQTNSNPPSGTEEKGTPSRDSTLGEVPYTFSEFSGYVKTPNTVSPSERVALRRNSRE